MVELLVTHYKCDINAKDIDEQTPLHVAAENGHLAVVKYLTGKNNCRVQERKGNSMITCLHLACISGCLPMVRFLIEELHFNPAIQSDDGAQPIHVTCRYGHLQMLKYLLEDNHTLCDPEAEDKNNLRPLHYAARHGHLDVVQYLVRVHQANPTAVAIWYAPDFTPVAAAIEGGYEEIKEYFSSIILDFISVDRTRRANIPHAGTGIPHAPDLLNWLF